MTGREKRQCAGTYLRIVATSVVNFEKSRRVAAPCRKCADQAHQPAVDCRQPVPARIDSGLLQTLAKRCYTRIGVSKHQYRTRAFELYERVSDEMGLAAARGRGPTIRGAAHD